MIYNSDSYTVSCFIRDNPNLTKGLSLKEKMDLHKAIDKAKLVPVKKVIHGNTNTYMAIRWVSPHEAQNLVKQGQAQPIEMKKLSGKNGKKIKSSQRITKTQNLQIDFNNPTSAKKTVSTFLSETLPKLEIPKSIQHIIREPIQPDEIKKVNENGMYFSINVDLSKLMSKREYSNHNTASFVKDCISRTIGEYLDKHVLLNGKNLFDLDSNKKDYNVFVYNPDGDTSEKSPNNNLTVRVYFNTTDPSQSAKADEQRNLNLQDEKQREKTSKFRDTYKSKTLNFPESQKTLVDHVQKIFSNIQYPSNKVNIFKTCRDFGENFSVNSVYVTPPIKPTDKPQLVIEFNGHPDLLYPQDFWDECAQRLMSHQAKNVITYGDSKEDYVKCPASGWSVEGVHKDDIVMQNTPVRFVHDLVPQDAKKLLSYITGESVEEQSNEEIAKPYIENLTTIQNAVSKNIDSCPTDLILPPKITGIQLRQIDTNTISFEALLAQGKLPSTDDLSESRRRDKLAEKAQSWFRKVLPKKPKPFSELGNLHYGDWYLEGVDGNSQLKVSCSITSDEDYAIKQEMEAYNNSVEALKTPKKQKSDDDVPSWVKEAQSGKPKQSSSDDDVPSWVKEAQSGKSDDTPSWVKEAKESQAPQQSEESRKKYLQQQQEKLMRKMQHTRDYQMHKMKHPPIKKTYTLPKNGKYRAYKNRNEAISVLGEGKPSEKGRTPTSKWLDGLSYMDKIKGELYTHGGSYSLNAFFRGLPRPTMSNTGFSSGGNQNKNYTAQDLQIMKSAARNLDSMIDRYELPEDIVVKRTVMIDSSNASSDEEAIENFFGGVGSVFQDKGYISTALAPNEDNYGNAEAFFIKDNADRGKRFIGCELTIKVPKGKGRGMFVDPLSNWKGQVEFVLARGSQFRVDTDLRNIVIKNLGESSLQGLRHVDVECTLIGKEAEDFDTVFYQQDQKGTIDPIDYDEYKKNPNPELNRYELTKWFNPRGAAKLKAKKGGK